MTITPSRWEAMVELMDDKIRESVHLDLSPCSYEEFLKEYMKRHEDEFGKEFDY